MNFPEPGMQLVLSVLTFLHLDGNWRVAAVFAPNLHQPYEFTKDVWGILYLKQTIAPRNVAP
jgi:hypothetical protein